MAVGADELKAFQNVLPGYQFICVYSGRNHEAVAFSPYAPEKKQLVIIHVDDHYHARSSLKGYRQSAHVCKYCFKGYDKEGQHRCKSEENTKFCLCCRRENCKEFLEAQPQGLKPQQKCKHCGRYFYGPECFDNHQKYGIDGKFSPANCICFNIRRCHNCKKLNRSKQDIRTHQCEFAQCPTCTDYVHLESHRCFIESAQKVRAKRKAEALKKKAKKAKQTATAAASQLTSSEDSQTAQDAAMEELMEDFEATEEERIPIDPKTDIPPIHIFFDIEAKQETGVHEANLLIYQDDQGQEKTFWGEDCVEAFIKDLKELTDRTQRRLVVIAHNLQSYDGYFIIRELYRDGKQLTQIRNGAKILEIEHYDIRFIDSLNFFAMPLKAFPKTFGLKYTERNTQGEEVEAFYAKGYFPHLFNRSENQTYVGPMPAKHFYMPETMSLEERENFDKWYAEQVKQNAIFDFRRDIHAYCQMDVRILREGCQTFQRLF